MREPHLGGKQSQFDALQATHHRVVLALRLLALTLGWVLLELALCLQMVLGQTLRREVLVLARVVAVALQQLGGDVRKVPKSMHCTLCSHIEIPMQNACSEFQTGACTKVLHQALLLLRCKFSAPLSMAMALVALVHQELICEGPRSEGRV